MTANFPSKVSAHEACDEVINAIKSSNLHFVLQETPHSVYITIRKKFVNKDFVKISGDTDTRTALRYLEIDHNNLKKDYKEKIATHEEALNLVKTLKDKLDKVEENSIIESNMLKNESIVKEKTHPKKKHKKVNEVEKKTEIKVENEEIIDIKDSDMNQNYEVSVPVHNRFEVFDHSKSPSTTALSTIGISDEPVSLSTRVDSSTGASHTLPGQLPRTPRGTPPRAPAGTPPGTPPSLARSPSPGQRAKPTILEIKEAFSEISVEMSAMADRLATRFDQACILPASMQTPDEYPPSSSN